MIRRHVCLPHPKTYEDIETSLAYIDKHHLFHQIILLPSKLRLLQGAIAFPIHHIRVELHEKIHEL